MAKKNEAKQKAYAPIGALNVLTRTMEKLLSDAEKAPHLYDKVNLLTEAGMSHGRTMQHFNQIYKGGNPKVEALKNSVRALYEKVKELKETNQALLNAKNEPLPLEQIKEKSRIQAEQVAAAVANKEQAKQAKIIEEQIKNLLASKTAEIGKTMAKIDAVLNELSTKISSVDKHRNPKAHATAVTLLTNLQAARDEYKSALESYDVKPVDAGKKFKEQCIAAVNAARPVLERDLGWGDFLTNILKAISNVVVAVGTVGYTTNFFPPAETASGKAIKHAEKELDLEDGYTPTI